jgi:DNA-binding PadR family transcriptional regulator
MSLKHAILGFLSYKSLSGYDLKKAFDHSIQHFWPANQSQIYRTLSGLHEAGLVELEVIEREERLDLKIYHITPAGREELHRWLSTPLPSQDYREPFLIQVYFAGKLTDREFDNLLQQEIRTIEGRLAEYNAVYRMYQENIKTHEDPRSFFLSVLTLEYGILSNIFSLEWLKSVMERAMSGNYTLRDFEQLVDMEN